MSSDADRRAESASASPDDNAIEATSIPRSGRRDTPEDFAKRYTIQQTALGGAWYYIDPKKREFAFRDRGRLLSTRLESPAVIKDMVAIAQHRGWQEIRLSGSANFQRQLWLEASLVGLAVRGYAPSEVDRAALVAAEQRHARDAPRRHGLEAPVTGRLVDAGTAPYANVEGNRRSSYLVIERSDGERHTIWGAALPGALVASRAEIGDEVTLHRGQPTRVTIDASGRDKDVPSAERREVQRNTWTIERKGPPDPGRTRLTPGALSQLRVVAAVVEANVKDPEQRAAILEVTRAYMAKELAKGRSFPMAVVRTNREQHREPAKAERAR